MELCDTRAERFKCHVNSARAAGRGVMDFIRPFVKANLWSVDTLPWAPNQSNCFITMDLRGGFHWHQIPLCDIYLTPL